MTQSVVFMSAASCIVAFANQSQCVFSNNLGVLVLLVTNECSIITRLLMFYLFFSFTGSHNLHAGLLLIFIIRALLSNPCTVCLLHVCLMFECSLFVCLLTVRSSLHNCDH